MSDGSSRTLLSLWGIKPDIEPDNNVPIETISSGLNGSYSSATDQPSALAEPRDSPENESLQPSNSVDRTKSVLQWNSIFSKPKKINTEPVQPQSDVTDTKVSVPIKRPQRPQNPFRPSFMHVLKLPPEQLSRLQRDESSKNFTIFNLNEPQEKPSFMHTLRVSPESLRSIKPKVHAFFAKRPTSAVSKTTRTKGNSLRPIILKHAPSAIIHVRPDIVYDAKYLTPLPKRCITELNALPSDDTLTHEWVSLSAPLPPLLSSSCIKLSHLPKRALYSSVQVRTLAALSHSRKNKGFLNKLISLSGEPKPFDNGNFETAMWAEKYAPQDFHQHLLSVETKKVVDWVAAQIQRPRKQRSWPPKRKRRNDDFVVEDGEEDYDENDILLLCGPCGSGKTSAVYAAARSLDAFVFEVNCGVKRTGKELSSLLNGISHNYAVHNAKHCIILIDDGDIVYENEAGGFWATLARFAATSRRPVILTCTDPSRIALSDVGIDTINLPMPDLVRVADTAWTIALSEGYVLSKSDIASLVVLAKGDIRRVLSHLQFWCQMGIGGRPSGIDWCAKDYEFMRNLAQRVISENTWCPSFSGTAEPSQKSIVLPTPSVPHNDDLLSFTARADEISELDAAFEPFVVERRCASEETVSSNGSLILSEWRAPAPAFELLSRSTVLKNEPASHLPNMRDIFADEYVSGTAIDSLMAMDIGPYMREIAACDFRRALVMEQSLAQNQSAREMRMTRRMWAASGIDSRQYLGYSLSSLQLILSTCLPSQLFEPGS